MFFFFQGIRNTSDPFADSNVFFKACQPAPGDSDAQILVKRKAIDFYNYCRSQYEELKRAEKLVEQLQKETESLKRNIERNT